MLWLSKYNVAQREEKIQGDKTVTNYVVVQEINLLTFLNSWMLLRFFSGLSSALFSAPSCSTSAPTCKLWHVTFLCYDQIILTNVCYYNFDFRHPIVCYIVQ